MATEVRFYHLSMRSPDQALPEILMKAVGGGRRVVVRLPDSEAVARFNDHLWTFQADVFLPHGAQADGFASEQPIWLTDRDENPNGADVLVLGGGATAENMAAFSLCCDVFDGRDEAAVAAARTRWKSYKDQDFTVTYWQQTDRGGWEQKV